MNARPIRTIVVLVVAVATTWFVARPAFGDRADAVQWRASVKDGPSDLAADGNGLVVTTSSQSVYAFTRDGHLRWRVAVDDVGLGQPALSRDDVLVGGMASVTVLDRSDGSPKWDLPRAASANSLAIAGDTALVGDDSGTLAAFDLATGAPRWSVQYPGALWSGARSDPARGVVVATWHQSDSPAVRAFDLGTGTLRWEAPTGRYTAAPVVHAGRAVLAIGDGDRHARVEARDLTTGALQWQTPVPASFEEAIEPAADDRTVAVVDHFGVASLLDLASGRLRWQHDVADVLVATRVALTGRRVAFTSYAGVLYVLDRSDGHLVERTEPDRLGGLPVATAAAPRRAPGRLLVALRLHEWGVQLRRLP
jgi:outer membrane protein assembly factor BamB